VHATANAASKTLHPAIRKCYESGQTPCSETTALTSVIQEGQAELPVFITQQVNILTIAATINSQAGTYKIAVVMSTPNSGNVSWNTITITMGICVIASIDTPTNPVMIEYLMFYPALVTTLTPNFTQRPACGYTITESLAWTIPGGAPITIDSTNKYRITAVSNDPTKHNSYTLILKDWITYGSQNFQPSITFTFKITDPCRTSVITAVPLTATWDVILGTTQE
jgi:hypothetical protein